MNMKKILSYILLVVIGISLTSCLVDGSWLKLVGRWKDQEFPDFEIEFTNGGRFTEYMYGKSVGYGEFYVKNDSITLHYLSECGEDDQVSCDLNLQFFVDGNELIITDSIGDLKYDRVESSQ